ncbi:hypothetical protein ACQPYK_43275 [Streptosporangium sp. CA-135522]|uniref:hypothetical protein n=1 Tax=Streptosporangium sp. CA-135522 TaxID=3240072 RepID=UPI003D8D47DC
MSDWHILCGVATRRVNGQDVRIKAGNHSSIEAAIEAWESEERARQVRDLAELGRLVNAAMTRLQVRYTAASRGEQPLITGDLQ